MAMIAYGPPARVSVGSAPRSPGSLFRSARERALAAKSSTLATKRTAANDQTVAARPLTKPEVH